MRQRMSSGRITALCVLLCLAFRVASRVSSVAYASAATDVLYMDGILPTVLYVLRQVFLAIAAGVSVAGVVLSAFAGTRRIRLATAWLFCLIPFADAASAFLIDVCSGAVSGGIAVLALILNTATFLMEWVFIFLVYGIAHSKKYIRLPTRAVLVASLIHLGGYVLLEAAYSLQYLSDRAFLLSAEQISGMVCTYLDLFAVQGIVVWLSARLLLRLLGGKESFILSIKGASHR